MQSSPCSGSIEAGLNMQDGAAEANLARIADATHRQR